MKIEVSIGEVVDKITILEIKKEHIEDNKKLEYITQELEILKQALVDEGVSVPENMINDLKNINQELWDTEDVIRLCERKEKFDEEFIKDKTSSKQIDLNDMFTQEFMAFTLNKDREFKHMNKSEFLCIPSNEFAISVVSF